MCGNNNDFNDDIKYLGYAGANLENLNLESFRRLKSVVSYIINSPNYNKLNILLERLPSLSLEQVKESTKKFYEKYFYLNNILTISLNKVQENAGYISLATTPTEAYQRINSLLTSINPLNIEIRLVEGHSMTGLVSKPLAMISTSLDNPLRKVYFSHLELGKQLNLISTGTMIHELAHLEQEQNIGYAEDYLNKEIISIFL